MVEAPVCKTGLSGFESRRYLQFLMPHLPQVNECRPDLFAGTGQFTVGAFLNAGGKSRAQTSIVLSPSSNPIVTLTDIVISAQVTSTGPAPTGSVTLYVDGIPEIGQNIGQLNASGQASFDIADLPKGNHNIFAIYSGDTLTAGSTSSSITETVNLRPVSFGLLSNHNPSVVGETVTLTGVVGDASQVPCTVTGGCGGIITGTVTFSDGGSVLGTSPVVVSNLPSGANPNASLDVSNLSAGSHQITGLYSGDQYFASATSAPLTQIVNLQGLGLAIGTGGSSSNTVSAGGTASYNRSIGGAGFSGVATIACSLALTGSNCSVPSTMNVTQNVASNFAATVTTTPRVMAVHPGTLSPNWLWAAILLGLAVMPQARRRETWVLGLILLLLLGGCGGGGSSPQMNPSGTPAGTYNMTVVASSGALHQSISLTLVVE